jgi:hypothetical protein
MKTEILVHIAAPSRAADDTDYRTLASAYLNFTAARRTQVTVGRESSSDAGDRNDGEEELPPTQTDDPGTSAGRRENALDSPNLSFRSVFNNLNSPNLRPVKDGLAEVQESQHGSWQPPPGVIPDSLPDNNLAMPQYCTPTRILEHFLSGLESSQSDLSPLTQRSLRRGALQGSGDVRGSSQDSAAASPTKQRDIPQSGGYGESQTRDAQTELPPPSGGVREDVTDSQVSHTHDVQQTRRASPPIFPPASVDESRISETRCVRQTGQASSPPIPPSAPREDESHISETRYAESSLQPTKDTHARSAVVPQTQVAGNKRYRDTVPAAAAATSEEASTTSSYSSQQIMGLTLSAAREVIPSSRGESEPPPAKRLRSSAVDCPEPGKQLARSSSDIGPRQEKAKTHRMKARVQLSHIHNLDTLEIRSPEPPVGCRDLEPADVVTDVLAKLARDLNLQKRFKPESQSRQLRPFERGYWLVDCTTWETALKQSSWGFLTDYLAKGAAGWGIWCRRDEAFTYMRLYCWGCVVGHMYLVLYLMSKRKLLYTGAEWIAADGKAVVVMGAKT